jgi:endonuclease YncB( thermonuclease family)
MGACISHRLRHPNAYKLTEKRFIPKDIETKLLPPFVAPITHGRVVKVYDGDTITIAAYLPYKESRLYKFSVRINGIDCPEMRSSGPSEKKIAVLARDTLSRKIMGEIVELVDVKTEKYGRLLATVMHNNESCGKMLIDLRMAVPYDGGTKNSPNDWVEYYEDDTRRGVPAVPRKSATSATKQ